MCRLDDSLMKKSKIPAGVNCDGCGRFIGQDGRILIDYETGYADSAYCGK